MAEEEANFGFPSACYHCTVMNGIAGAAVSLRHITAVGCMSALHCSGVCDVYVPSAPPARRQLPQLSFHRRRLHSSSTSSLVRFAVPSHRTCLTANLDVSASLRPCPSVGSWALRHSPHLRRASGLRSDSGRHSTKVGSTQPRSTATHSTQYTLQAARTLPARTVLSRGSSNASGYMRA